MKTYEFTFSDGTCLLGEGEDLADALHDAYHRSGFLPICDLVEKKLLNNSEPESVGDFFEGAKEIVIVTPHTPRKNRSRR